jgi:hypothetical protein
MTSTSAELKAQKKFRESTKGKKYRKNWLQTPKGKAYQKREKSKQTAKVRARWDGLKRKYGITREEYEARYNNNEGCCEICNDWCEILVVDHNHTTNEVRGLLCHTCNSGIGMFKESLEVINRAKKYMELNS